jgi:cytochrome c peroxidase
MTELTPEHGVGLVAVIVLAFMLLIAVTGELAPTGRLSSRGRWLLASALGSGLLAFVFKLALIASLSTDMLDRWLIGLPAATRPAPPLPRIDTERWRAEPQVWQALPEHAPRPAGAPYGPTAEALGKRLFFDTRLSRDRSLACASCHDLVQAGGADGRPMSTGIDAQRGTRNAPTVWNAAFQSRLFWDGRADSLEAQAAGPFVNPVEMGMPDMAAVVDRIAADPGYRQDFARVFGDRGPITPARVTAAIAAFERTLITPDSRYDRFVRGDASALSATELRGMALFETVGCIQCHSGPNFSEASVFGSGAPFRVFPSRVLARHARLNLSADTGLAPAGSPAGVWRVPSLRNVALTAPYFHNGAVARLEDAVRIMAQTQLGWHLSSEDDIRTSAWWSAPARRLATVRPRVLSEIDVQDITAFLRALSSESLLALRADGGDESASRPSDRPSGGLSAGMR